MSWSWDRADAATESDDSSAWRGVREDFVASVGLLGRCEFCSLAAGEERRGESSAVAEGEMGWDSGVLDMVLVPSGVLMMAAYHVYLWLKVKYHPETTIIGINHLNRQEWVNNIMSVRIPPLSLSLYTLFCELSISGSPLRSFGNGSLVVGFWFWLLYWLRFMLHEVNFCEILEVSQMT